MIKRITRLLVPLLNFIKHLIRKKTLIAIATRVNSLHKLGNPPIILIKFEIGTSDDLKFNLSPIFSIPKEYFSWSNKAKH